MCSWHVMQLKKTWKTMYGILEMLVLMHDFKISEQDAIVFACELSLRRWFRRWLGLFEHSQKELLSIGTLCFSFEVSLPPDGMFVGFAASMDSLCFPWSVSSLRVLHCRRWRWNDAHLNRLGLWRLHQGLLLLWRLHRGLLWRLHHGRRALEWWA